MIVVNIEVVQAFIEKHRDAEQQALSFVNELENATWNSPYEMKQSFPTADPIKGGCTVFNIRGNHYRFVVKINYQRKIASIRWCGTHGDYSKLDLEGTKCLSQS